MSSMKRRELFKLAIGSAGALLGARMPFAYGQTSNASPHVTALRDGLQRIAGAGGNIVVLEGAEGIALVDSGAPPYARDVTDLLSERYAGRRVEALFNTHWHLEHTGGNEAVAAALLASGAPIIAHENTRLWMSTKFHVDWEDKTYPPRPESAQPTRTFHTSDPQPRELDFGGEDIVYGHLREAHTDGDIYVQFPERHVIVAGGAVTNRTWPIMDFITGGWIGGLVDATEKLMSLSDAETLVVPQSGPPQSRADLVAQREMLATVRERMESMALEGMSAEDMLEAGVTRDFEQRWSGNKQLFISNAYDGLWWGSRLRGIIA